MYFKSTCSIALAIFLSSPVLNAKTNDISALVEQARELAFGGLYENAILNYSEAVELQPADDALRLTLAQLLRDTGDHDQAQTLLKVAVDAGAKDPRIHLLLGELLESTDRDAASAQYRATIEADPASNAAVDAVANLEVLDNDDVSSRDGGSKSQIEWSNTPDDASFEQLGKQLDGQWCVQLVDIYHHEAGMCLHDPLAGDLAVIDGFPKVDIRVDAVNKALVSQSLTKVTEVTLPEDRSIDSIDTAVGDHYQVHTLNFKDGRYVDVNLSDSNSQCIYLQQFERGTELFNCPNAYTLCRCQ